VIALALVTLLLAPWQGPSLPTASAAAAKYRLTVHGAPRSSVDLRASGLPSGWVASFCTATLCSPFRYTMHLNARGAGTIEFQAIRTDDRAPGRARVTVSAPGAISRTVSVVSP
jgi:hypothetical protein